MPRFLLGESIEATREKRSFRLKYRFDDSKAVDIGELMRYHGYKR